MTIESDTIAAVATPIGVGGIAAVRISGGRALAVLEAVAPEADVRARPREATLASFVDAATGEPLDRGLVTYFAGPASYTGEDVVELSCHGGFLTPRLVLESCLSAGARLAEPGEFTRRAYLHGKMDLVQVEAVHDVIEARSRAMHRAASRQIERGLSDRIVGLRRALVGLEARLAHHIDFPEEDDAPVPLEALGDEAGGIADAMGELLKTAPEGELLREGAVTVLAGAPNSGKSSLFNALIGEERAIVTEEPGTTRDALEAVVQIGGFPFRLVDTAGLREGAGRVEAMGIEVARRHLAGADVVLFCVPADAEMTPEEWGFLVGVDRPVVLVRTMLDVVASLRSGKGRTGSESGGEGGDIAPAEDLPDSVIAEVGVSSRTGDGMPEFRELLPECVFSALTAMEADVPVLTRERHSRALALARSEVEAFRAALGEGIPAEMASTHLRSAETALEEMLGVISVEDILDHVFAEFCIGK